jgi:hypothetical protein
MMLFHDQASFAWPWSHKCFYGKRIVKLYFGVTAGGDGTRSVAWASTALADANRSFHTGDGPRNRQGPLYRTDRPKCAR